MLAAPTQIDFSTYIYTNSQSEMDKNLKQQNCCMIIIHTKYQKIKQFQALLLKFHQIFEQFNNNGLSPSGKERDFDSRIRGFESH